MEYKNGVAYSSKTGALYMSAGVATYGSEDGQIFTPTPEQANRDFTNSEWSRWGQNNLLPCEMADHIENCGVLNAALDAKARISLGKGHQPFLLTNIDPNGKEELEWVDDSEIHDFLEENHFLDIENDTSLDANGYGWSAGRLIVNKGFNKINRVNRIDIHTARLEKMKDNGVIENIFLCNDWKGAGVKYDAKKMAKIPMLKEGYEAVSLQGRKGSGKFEFAYMNRNIRHGRNYYPIPLWWSARGWVKVARSIPAFKNAMFNNQSTIKYIISISDKYWESVYGDDWTTNKQTYSQETKEEIMRKKYQELDTWLTGTENAYKSLSSGTYYDENTQAEVPFIKIEVLDDKVKDGKLLPDSSAANSEILFAIAMNPALIGAGQPGGPYSQNAGGSNIRESYLIQLMLLENERRKNTNILNLVKKFNQWDKRLEKERTVVSMSAAAASSAGNTTEKKIKPRLVFRCVSGLLTTLDTGKSTKAEPL